MIKSNLDSNKSYVQKEMGYIKKSIIRKFKID